MRKIFAILLVFVILLVGCGGNDGASERGIDENGLSFPYDMDLNGNTVAAESIQLYQEASDHGFSVYAVVVLDISSLSEDDLYWMDEDESLETEVYLTSDENSLSTKSMVHVATLDKDGKRYLGFCLLQELRKADDIKYSFVATLVQQEKYEYKNKEGKTSMLNKRNRYSFSSIEAGAADSIPEAITMDADVYTRMVNNLGAVARSLS